MVAGPWYVQPDEFLVSGEALIRNLRRGRELVRSFGAEPSDTGFLCDLFGHNSQMPQLFAGFGIEGGYLWRGLNLNQVRHVRWRGADGTEMPCYRFGTNGYWGFAVHVSNFTDHADAIAMTPDVLRQRFEAYFEGEANCTEIDDVLIFHGPDHLQADEAFGAAWRQVLGRSDDGGYKLRHGSLDEYHRAMLDQANRIGTVVEGELIDPGKEPLEVEQQWLTGGTLASRPWIKQANAAAQAALCHWAEPWTWAASGLGLKVAPPGLLDLAWKYLLQNQPHDSICGCSVDDVHEDMAYRFRQCAQLSERVISTATRRIAEAVTIEQPDNEHRLVFFHALPRPQDEVCEVEIDVPRDWPKTERFGHTPEPIVNAKLLDESGQVVPFQRLGQSLNHVKLVKADAHAPNPQRTDRLRIAVRPDTPAMGYRTFRIAPAEQGDPPHGVGPIEREAQPTVALDARTLANEHVRVAVNPAGTLRLTDLRTHQTYDGLLEFEDRGDIGDGWHFESPANDQCFSSAGAAHQVALIDDGPLQATMRVRTTLSLPQAYDRDRQQRSAAFIPQTIDTYITLRAGSPRIGVRVELDHAVRDHRLRVLLPTGCAATHYFADTPFDVVERPIALRPDNHRYRDPELETKPQQSWSAVQQEDRGLAVVAAGLMESAVLDRPDRAIALTLLRATQRTVFTNGQPGGQVQGDQTFRFVFEPLATAPDRAGLTECGQSLNAGPCVVQVSDVQLRQAKPPVALPPAREQLRLEGPAVLTSVMPDKSDRPATAELRLFNPESEPATAVLHFPDDARPTTACPVNLEGQPIGEPQPVPASGLSVSLRAKQIVTLVLGRS